MVRNIVRQILVFFRKWFWEKQITPIPKEKLNIPATEVLHAWVCMKYKDQWINIRKSQVKVWNRMSRKDRRGMAHKFAMMEKKGGIKFVEVDGKMTCVKNLDYEARARKHEG